MLKNHPKGLLVASLTNLGERFGFYTMMAVLVLFLQAKFGLDEQLAGKIYSGFYFAIYALALVGGILADKFIGTKRTISIGIFLMFFGYLSLSIPFGGFSLVIFSLAVIALGNGFFKGNLQALVGQLYDNPKYKGFSRDAGFSLFYMFINIGAFFAPSMAVGIRNWWLEKNNFLYDGSLPKLCHAFIKGENINTEKFQLLANKVSNVNVTDLGAFAKEYLNAFSTGYHYAFGLAVLSMVVSIIIYFVFNKNLEIQDKVKESKNINDPISSKDEMPASEVKQRVTALLLVFAVVIFFWMSFHQNGLTMNIFARDYIQKSVNPATYMLFDLKSLLSVILTIAGIVMLLRKGSTFNKKIIYYVMTIVGATLSFFFYKNHLKVGGDLPISAEIFQQFNPLFIVTLTAVVIGIISFVEKRIVKKTISTPRKIGYGMILASVPFFILMFGSFGLTSPSQLGGNPVPSEQLISPYWMISSYLIITFAELLLSPMGISFVSKVAPPKYQGLMQGGWLGATAIGNSLLFIGTELWAKIDVWMVWVFFAICCLVSAIIIFSLMKKLEKVS